MAVIEMDLKEIRKRQGRTALVTLSALALACEYFTKVEIDLAAAAQCKVGLRVIEENNSVYVTPAVYQLVHKNMDATKAVRALLLPNI